MPRGHLSDHLVLQQWRTALGRLERAGPLGRERGARVRVGAAERRIGHHFDAVAQAEGRQFGLSQVGVQLALVHSGRIVRKGLEQLLQLLNGEVAHTDVRAQARTAKCDHLSPRAEEFDPQLELWVWRAVRTPQAAECSQVSLLHSPWPVHEIEVNGGQAQLTQRLLQALLWPVRLRLVPNVVRVEELGDDDDILAPHNLITHGSSKRLAHFRLIVVCGSTIK
mmetsp:Transcript_39489/g.84167  ORF Transcript_39489/g.84167 Transcript_39489/m.84167 type:complete len:223 (+) Transcript_39489:667-1335(+)